MEITTQCNAIAWNGSMWVAVGEGTNTIAYSYDGINWTGATTTHFTNRGRDVAWNGNIWVAVGDNVTAIKTITWSTDGDTWIAATSGGFATEGWGITWTGQNWVSVGNDGGSNPIQYSSDGKNWYNSTPANCNI